jgi:type II secretory pathway component GspD/PulD (secretin)
MSTLRRTCILWSVSLVCLGQTATRIEAVSSDTQASESPCPEPRDQSMVTLHFEEIDIDSAAKFVGEITGRHYVVEGSQEVQFDFVAEDEITVDEAEKLFLAAARKLGCKVIESEDGVRIIKPPPGSGIALGKSICPPMRCECDDGSAKTFRNYRAYDCREAEACPLVCKEAGWNGRRWSMPESTPPVRSTSEAD